MSLDLDDRQRAMLREMGVHVWLPSPAPASDEPAHHAIKNIASYADPICTTGQEGLNSSNPTPLHGNSPVVTLHAVAAVPQQGSEPGPAASAPATAAPSVASTAPTAGKRSVARVTTAAGPTMVTGLPGGISTMDWPALGDAVAQCQACAMCFGRKSPVLEAPLALSPCDWLVVGDPPDEAQERAGLPFVDETGKLLDNMLRAVGVRRFAPDTALPAEPAQRAYLTHVLKCRPALMRAPDAAELVTCANYLRREIALTQPKVILAMGRFAMQVLLSETPPERAKLPLGKLRGQVWQFAGVPVVVTYPPSYLLRSGQDKGKAWADLCLAQDVAQGQLPV